MSLTESTFSFSFLLEALKALLLEYSIEFAYLWEAILFSLLRPQYEFLEVRLPILEVALPFFPLLAM